MWEFIFSSQSLFSERKKENQKKKSVIKLLVVRFPQMCSRQNETYATYLQSGWSAVLFLKQQRRQDSTLLSQQWLREAPWDWSPEIRPKSCPLQRRQALSAIRFFPLEPFTWRHGGHIIRSLRNRTGEERRRKTLCDKRDNNLVWKTLPPNFTLL